MPAESFSQLQDKLDQLARDYIARHEGFAEFVQANDPALVGKDMNEVRAEIAFYPGVIAIAAHEAAHQLMEEAKHDGQLGKRVQARQLTEAAHSRTGIDIHPGTTIGENCFLDHGTGDVIGETAKLGKNTRIYHGVTLGAYGKPESLAHRHPEVGDNCIISVGVQVLGNAKIGNNVSIGAGARLMGNHITVGDGASIGAGAQIGENNHIEAGARVGAGVVIAPSREPRTITKTMLEEAGVSNGENMGLAPTSLGVLQRLLAQMAPTGLPGHG